MLASASGMLAASTQFAVAAGNIANADTPSYEARAATLAAQASSGVAVTGVGVLSGAPAAPPGTSNVDLGEQMVNVMIASGMSHGERPGAVGREPDDRLPVRRARVAGAYLSAGAGSIAALRPHRPIVKESPCP